MTLAAQARYEERLPRARANLEERVQGYLKAGKDPRLFAEKFTNFFKKRMWVIEHVAAHGYFEDGGAPHPEYGAITRYEEAGALADVTALDERAEELLSPEDFEIYRTQYDKAWGRVEKYGQVAPSAAALLAARRYRKFEAPYHAAKAASERGGRGSRPGGGGSSTIRGFGGGAGDAGLPTFVPTAGRPAGYAASGEQTVQSTAQQSGGGSLDHAASRSTPRDTEGQDIGYGSSSIDAGNGSNSYGGQWVWTTEPQYQGFTAFPPRSRDYTPNPSYMFARGGQRLGTWQENADGHGRPQLKRP